MSLEDQLTEEQRIERAAARQRLDAEVAEMKKREERGEKTRVAENHAEREARILASHNILSMGDAIKEAMPIFERLAASSEKFSAALKERLAKIKPEMCIDHPEQALPIDQERTFSESWRDKKLRVVWGGCPLCIEERRASLVNERWRKMGVPDKVAHATFDNFETDTDSKKKALAKAKRQFEQRRGFLILRGSFGTGKSHLAAAILKAFNNGLFITLHDLIGLLRQTYEEGGQEMLVNLYRETECFVLDEVDKTVKGSDVSGILYRILAHRYDKGKLTVLTSNDSLGEILDILGGRLKDRIRDDYQCATMEWESHRGQKHETT